MSEAATTPAKAEVVSSPPAREPDDAASFPLYARAHGGATPPLLMNPSPDWTVRFFTKLGQRSLYVRLAAPVETYRSSDGTRLDPEATLGSLGLLPYEMLEFRTAATSQTAP